MQREDNQRNGRIFLSGLPEDIPGSPTNASAKISRAFASRKSLRAAPEKGQLTTWYPMQANAGDKGSRATALHCFEGKYHRPQHFRDLVLLRVHEMRNFFRLDLKLDNPVPLRSSYLESLRRPHVSRRDASGIPGCAFYSGSHGIRVLSAASQLGRTQTKPSRRPRSVAVVSPRQPRRLRADCEDCCQFNRSSPHTLWYGQCVPLTAPQRGRLCKRFEEPHKSAS